MLALFKLGQDESHRTLPLARARVNAASGSPREPASSVDAQARVLRHQEAVLKARHAMEARLLDSTQRGRTQLAKQAVDHFYAQYSLAHQHVVQIDRGEQGARSLQRRR